MLWEPEMITWFLDGKPLHSEKAYAIFDRQDYFLVIGMQEGANWHAGDLAGITAQQMTLTLDWVRVWQKSQKR
jgi:beta-glucanase (GH16 family)